MNLNLAYDRFWMQYFNHRILRRHGVWASLRFAWKHWRDKDV